MASQRSERVEGSPTDRDDSRKDRTGPLEDGQTSNGWAPRLSMRCDKHSNRRPPDCSKGCSQTGTKDRFIPSIVRLRVEKEGAGGHPRDPISPFLFRTAANGHHV